MFSLYSTVDAELIKSDCFVDRLRSSKSGGDYVSSLTASDLTNTAGLLAFLK